MKSLHRFTKGILISLMASFLLSFSLPLLSFSNGLLEAKSAYALEEPEAGSGDFRDDIKPTTNAPQEAKSAEELVTQVANLANKTHRLFAPFINLFAFHIGNFLGTDYIFEGDMGKMLQKIWVISRNLVNIVFVFLLLWIALNTIFNPAYDLAKLKDQMIWFVLLLVAVNFSWMASKVLLDAANVVTHAVFAIPSGISDPPSGENPCRVNGPEEDISGACYPTTIIAPADAGVFRPLVFEDTGKDDDHCAQMKKGYEDAYHENGTLNNAPSDEKNKVFQRRIGICYENLNLTKYDQNTAVIYLTYGMARIQNLITASPAQKIDDLAVSVLLSVVIQLAYTISLLALFLVMIMRVAMLWMLVAFSPFLVLMLYLSKSMEKDFADVNRYFSFDAFLKWAFVPAKVGVIFVVSFIMISTGQSVSEINSKFIDKLGSNAGFVFKMPEITTMFAGIGSLWQFVWLLMSLVVLWMGVFAVLGDMPVIGAITTKIGDWGKEMGRMVAEAPYKTPFLQLGQGGEKKSIAQALSPLSVQSLRKKYFDEEDNYRAIQEFEKRAPKQNMAGYMTQVSRGLNRSDADRIAKDYGFTDVVSMMKVNQETLKAGFTKSRGYQTGDENKLYNELKRYERGGESTEERSRRLRDDKAVTQEGTAAGIAQAGGLPPPATATAPAPPTTPPPTAPE